MKVQISLIIAEIVLFEKWDFVLHFQGQLMWRYCCQPQLHHFGESLVEIGSIGAKINDFCKWWPWPAFSTSADMTFLLPATLSSFVWKFGNNRSFNSWDTAIFVNDGHAYIFQVRWCNIFDCRPWCHHCEICLKLVQGYLIYKQIHETLPFLWPWFLMSRSSK